MARILCKSLALHETYSNGTTKRAKPKASFPNLIPYVCAPNWMQHFYVFWIMAIAAHSCITSFLCSCYSSLFVDLLFTCIQIQTSKFLSRNKKRRKKEHKMCNATKAGPIEMLGYMTSEKSTTFNKLTAMLACSIKRSIRQQTRAAHGKKSSQLNVT